MVAEEFNRNAFIDCNVFDNDFDAVIEEIKRIDNDSELAKYMILQSPVRSDYDFAWEEHLLDFLTGIVENGRKYYDRMARKKVVADTDRPDTLNYGMYRRGIVESLKEQKEIVIYGKGNFATKIKEFLDVKEIGNVSACLVSKASDMDGKFMGLPIVSIDNWKPQTKDPLILIAVRESGQEDLIKSLIERGYSNFLSINDFLIEVVK